jgi:hypothetical protein
MIRGMVPASRQRGRAGGVVVVVVVDVVTGGLSPTATTTGSPMRGQPNGTAMGVPSDPVGQPVPWSAPPRTVRFPSVPAAGRLHATPTRWEYVDTGTEKVVASGLPPMPRVSVAGVGTCPDQRPRSACSVGRSPAATCVGAMPPASTSIRPMLPKEHRAEKRNHCCEPSSGRSSATVTDVVPWSEHWTSSGAADPAATTDASISARSPRLIGPYTLARTVSCWGAGSANR